MTKLLAMIAAALLLVSTPVEVEEPAPEPEPYIFDYSQDIQYPEMPNGCEATALSTLLRLNGYEVTKFEVADAMPKGSDFVNQYIGNPYTYDSWACMAPCSTATANMFVTEAVDMTGTPLNELPLPATVWVTIDMEEPIFSGYESQGYRLMSNPHCITITTIGVTAKAIDPLKGWVELDNDHLEYIYDQMGRQAVYIKEI